MSGEVQIIKKSYNTIAVIILMLCCLASVYANHADSTLFFKGSVSVTQNGFSFIPSFALGKPAAMLDLSIGNKRLSFEPQFRFALEGRPWSFIFIYRYKFINRKKFQFAVGGHLPAFNFRTTTITNNGHSQDVSVAYRFLAGELMPNYAINENISVGMYFLRGHGFDSGTTRNASFLALRANVNKIALTRSIFVRFQPQFFYLNSDSKEGYYANYTLIIGADRFPLSVSHILNKAIQTNIPAKTFDWNLSLIYSISKSYGRK